MTFEIGTEVVLWVCVTLVLAGFVKGTIGFGLPLVALSVLTQMLPKEWALALMVLPVVFSNLFIGFQGAQFRPTLARFWPLILAVGSGILAGSWWLGAMPQAHFLLLTGLVVIAVVLLDTFKLVLPVPAHHERAVGLGAGLCGGVLGGISTAFGPPLILYFTALRLPKDQFVSAIGVVWTFSSLFLLVAFQGSGVLNGERFLWSLGACAPVGIGLWLGIRLRGRIPQTLFRRLVAVALVLLGLNMVRRGLMGS
jgi:uncharacterized membrane protein YfcA